MGLKTWNLTSDEELTEDDRNKIVNEILQGSNGGIIYSTDYSISNNTSTSTPSKNNCIPECIELIKEGSILGAIRFYKDQTGVGLRDAKRFIDDLREKIKSND